MRDFSAGIIDPLCAHVAIERRHGDLDDEENFIGPYKAVPTRCP